MRRVFAPLALAVLTVIASAQWVPPTTAVPAYFRAPPRSATGTLLQQDRMEPRYFTRRYQTVAYEMAAAVPEVLYQLPCYCRCDRVLHHKSLHSCFEDTHGTTCTTCMKEAVYAYRQTREGRTPAQIRSGIMHGDAIEIDLPGIHLD